MKTAASTLTIAFALSAVSACTTSLVTAAQRQLQIVPQNNSPQGPFRPNGPRPQQGNTGMMPPANVGNEQTSVGAGATPGTATNAEADAASATADGSTAAANTATVSPDAAAPPTAAAGAGGGAGGLAPNQPTIMVILPDFLAVGSGWSSYSDDVGDKTQSVDTPTAAPTSMATSPRLSGLAAAAVAVSMAAVGLGLQVIA